MHSAMSAGAISSLDQGPARLRSNTDSIIRLSSASCRPSVGTTKNELVLAATYVLARHTALVATSSGHVREADNLTVDAYAIAPNIQSHMLCMEALSTTGSSRSGWVPRKLSG